MSHLGERVSALVDGQLGPADTERAHEHLAQCRPCRDDVSAAQAAKALVSALQGPAPGSDLMERLHALGGPQGPLPPRAGRVPGTPRPRSVPVGRAAVLTPVGAAVARPVRPAASVAGRRRGTAPAARPEGVPRPAGRPGRAVRARAALAVGALSVLGVAAAAGWTGVAGPERSRVPPAGTFVVEQATTGVRPLSPPTAPVSVNWADPVSLFVTTGN